MTHTYTTAEAAIVASALAVAVEQQIAAGLIPMPGEPKRFVAFGEMSELRNLVQDAAPSAQQAAGSIDTRNVCEIDRSSDMGVTVKFMSARAASQFVSELGGLWDTVTLYQPPAAATPAQPIAPTDEALVALLDGYARDGTLGYQHYVERIIAWADARKVAQPIAVSAPTDEQQAFNAAYAKVLGHPVQALELETAWRMMVGDMWRAARAAAPVSGQGASIGDDAEFRELAAAVMRHPFDGIAYPALVQFIDSRPRSEDSRAKVLLDPDEGVAVARLRALASTTPQKADNE